MPAPFTYGRRPLREADGRESPFRGVTFIKNGRRGGRNNQAKQGGVCQQTAINHVRHTVAGWPDLGAGRKMSIDCLTSDIFVSEKGA